MFDQILVIIPTKTQSLSLKEIAKILSVAADNDDSFITVSTGIFETNIVIRQRLKPYIKDFLYMRD